MSVNWGRVLATQHSRADKKFRNARFVFTSFPDSVSDLTHGHTDEFVALTQAVAVTYAQQVVADYTSFRLRFDAVYGIPGTTANANLEPQLHLGLDLDPGVTSSTSPETDVGGGALWVAVIALLVLVGLVMRLRRRGDVVKPTRAYNYMTIAPTMDVGPDMEPQQPQRAPDVLVQSEAYHC